jgi:hypothetical protein
VQKTAFCFIQSATTGFTANVFPYHIRVSLKEAFEGPEPDDRKLSRPVLRGPAPSNGGWLLGELHDLQIDRTSCSRFWANQFRVLLTAAAYVLMQELRLRAAGTDCARAQVGTLRDRLLKLGARVMVSVRRIVVHLPVSFPFQSTFARIAMSLGAQSG